MVAILAYGKGIGKWRRFSAVSKLYTLIGRDGKTYLSSQKGTLGGHKRLKIYGRLNCPSALRHIARGDYVRYRVFFADEETAVAAGYRPCAVCMKEQYTLWKQRQKEERKDMTLPRILFINTGDTLCEIEMPDNTTRRLPMDSVKGTPVHELLQELEGYSIHLEGTYAVITLLGASGQSGFTLIWDLSSDSAVHISRTLFAVCSTICGESVVTMYLISYYGHPADLWYSILPLNDMNTEQEPDLVKLELTAEDIRNPMEDCRISVNDGELSFQAGKNEQRIRA